MFFFYDPPENSLCVYVFTTMVELQLHYSRTNWLFLDIHPLCLKGSRTNIVCSLGFTFKFVPVPTLLANILILVSSKGKCVGQKVSLNERTLLKSNPRKALLDKI